MPPLPCNAARACTSHWPNGPAATVLSFALVNKLFMKLRLLLSHGSGAHELPITRTTAGYDCYSSSMDQQRSNNATTTAWLQIHTCVLLWGCTAILGKLITLSAITLVWWRMLLVALALLLSPKVWQTLRRMPLKLCARYLGIGCIVALHWLCFYGSVKFANASVAATTMALASVFLAFIEPWIMAHKIKPAELLLGIAIIPGVVLVAGGTPERMHWGLILGVLSALFVAIFGALNKRFVGDTDAATMTLLEMTGGWLFITMLLPWLPASEAALSLPRGMDAVLMLILCLACTLLPFVMALQALRHLSAFGAQLAINLEPVYAITLGIVLLGEQRELQPSFYLGVVIILATIFIYPLLHRDNPTAPAPID
jgi:drug/metabolite transporter (DMT)-like permease